jgi:hypothetical protein
MFISALNVNSESLFVVSSYVLISLSHNSNKQQSNKFHRNQTTNSKLQQYDCSIVAQRQSYKQETTHGNCCLFDFFNCNFSNYHAFAFFTSKKSAVKVFFVTGTITRTMDKRTNGDDKTIHPARIKNKSRQ